MRSHFKFFARENVQRVGTWCWVRLQTPRRSAACSLTCGRRLLSSLHLKNRSMIAQEFSASAAGLGFQRRQPLSQILPTESILLFRVAEIGNPSHWCGRWRDGHFCFTPACNAMRIESHVVTQNLFDRIKALWLQLSVRDWNCVMIQQETISRFGVVPFMGGDARESPSKRFFLPRCYYSLRKQIVRGHRCPKRYQSVQQHLCSICYGSKSVSDSSYS